MNILNRFWSKVKFTQSCWVWEGAKLANGYGRFWVDGGMVMAHRYSYEIHQEKIPNGVFIDKEILGS